MYLGSEHQSQETKSSGVRAKALSAGVLNSNLKIAGSINHSPNDLLAANNPQAPPDVATEPKKKREMESQDHHK